MAVAGIISARSFCRIERLCGIGLLGGIMCWLLPAAADAATVSVTLSNLTFQAAAGNNSCSGKRCTETFNVTFQYDSTTGFALGPVNVSGAGALSAADIGGPWTVQPTNDGLGHYFVYLAEFPPGPDYITIADTDLKYGMSGTPARGTYPFSHASMGCFANPTQCYQKFVYVSGGAAHGPGAAICGTVSVTVLPVIGPIWPRQGYLRPYASRRSPAAFLPCGLIVKRATKSR
jgi:hypothetical protein